MSDPWQYRCPEGHASIIVGDDGFWCSACEATYRGDPFDARETSFPTDEGVAVPRPLPDDLLGDVVRVCTGATRTWTTSKELAERRADGSSASSLSNVLRGLDNAGFVQRQDASLRTLWRPTPDGIDHVAARWKAEIEATAPDAPETDANA